MSRFRVFDGLAQIVPIKSMRDNNDFNNDSHDAIYIIHIIGGKFGRGGGREGGGGEGVT